MKIVPKLTLAFVAGTCVILAINGYFRVHREIAAFEADRMTDDEMIGRSIVAAASAVWRADGEAAALATLEDANAHFGRIKIRFVPPEERLAGVAPGSDGPMTRVTRDALGQSFFTTHVPLDVEGRRRGVVELVEPTTVEDRFARGVFVDAVLAAGAVALLSALLSFLMGQWLVGGPVGAISEKARRIGRGDLDHPLELRSRDELGSLARDVNAMCDRLRATIAQLRHADRLTTVGKLASGVAHELGTPLNVISARAEMIATGEATEVEARSYAGVIIGAADRMTKIIRQLLQFARRASAQKAPCDLATIVRETVELLRPLADKRSTRLELASSELDTKLDADAAQLQQVVTNLVMNAVQAMPSGGRVSLRVDEAREAPPADLGSEEGVYLRLQVEDEGEGIAEDVLAHVFEPFFTTKDVGEGTGLGLAVAHGIVRDHGGFISVESAVGVGTTFSVHLPRRATL